MNRKTVIDRRDFDPIVKPSNLEFQLDEFYLDLVEDGNTLKLLSPEEIEKNPFPGLRPYRTSEFQLFKGRGGQAEDLISRLEKNKFLAVIGSSGTGKSSLIRAGLIPQLYGGYLRSAGNRWNIAICRPGKNPVKNLGMALSYMMNQSRENEELHSAFQKLEPLLNSSIYGLLHVNTLINERHQDDEKRNLLVIIDQFEELFRFDRKDIYQEDIESHFVNLLLRAFSSVKESIYVIITMRSEFLGDCVRFPGLPEAINSGQYLVPQLHRNQIKEVIEGPVKLAGKSISSGLTELLINKIERGKLSDNHDQLPILQHALMRTYNKAKQDSDASIKIDYERHYKAIGGMESALAQHADEIYNKIGLADGNENFEVAATKKQNITKIIFQALTDQSEGLKGGRRPLELKKLHSLAELADANELEVNDVINIFRQKDTSFLMPPSTTRLNDNLIIDISHESLMRNWPRLQDWIEEEVRYGKLYSRLNDRREQYDLGSDDLIKGILLKDLQALKLTRPINAAWASRYHSSTSYESGNCNDQDLFNKNMLFMDKSLNAYEKEETDKKVALEEEIHRSEKEKTQKKSMKVLKIAAIVSLICLLIMLYYEREARSESKLANDRKDTLERTVNVLNLKIDTIQKQKMSIDSLFDSLQLNIGIAKNLEKKAVLQKNEIDAKNKALEQQMAEIHLYKEAFYTSNIDSSTKQSLISVILNHRKNKSVKVDFSKYIDLEAVNNVNKAALALEDLQYNSRQNLKLAKEIWQENPNKKWIQDLFANIFSANIFYKQQVKLPADEFYSLSMSRFKPGFVVSSGDRISLGMFARDSVQTKSLIARYAKKLMSASSGNIIASSTEANDTIFTLSRSGTLFQWHNGTSTLVGRIEPLSAVEFLPKRHCLIGIINNYLKIYSFKNIGEQESPNVIEVSSHMLDNYEQSLLQLILSPDGNKILIVSGEQPKLYTINDKNQLVANTNFNANSTTPNNTAATFSRDNEPIIAGRDGNIYLFNDSGKVKSKFFLPSLKLPSEIGIINNGVTAMKISDDQKRLIIKRNNQLFLLEYKNGSDFFSAKRKYPKPGIDDNLRFRQLLGFDSPLGEFEFLNDKTLLTLEENGFLNLWDLRQSFRNLKIAFSAVNNLIQPTVEENIKQGLIGYKDIINSTDRDLLEKAAGYYYDSRLERDSEETRSKLVDLERVKSIYLKLLDLGNDYTNTFYIRRIITLNELLIFNDQLDNTSMETVHDRFSRIVGRTNQNLRLLLPIYNSGISEPYYARQLSNIFGSQSFYQLFLRDYRGAIISATKGLTFDIDSRNSWINTNLALGYLLSGEFSQAKVIYLKYKDQKTGGRKFSTVFLQDFADLEAAKIISGQEPDVQKIKSLLQGN